MLKYINAGVLRVAYLEAGDPAGPPVVLLHGFPYDVCAYTQVTPILTAAGCRVIVPYLRGYGPTEFLSEDTPRSGQQAALGNDLLALLDALAIPKAAVAGYDWGGRAACIVSALWPERVTGLVTVNGYNIQNIAASGQPQSPQGEHRHWYQYYLHGERGRAGLDQNRFEFCKLLWQLWSPNWQIDAGVYERSAEAFENPDFVAVVVHSYRHRYALVEGDPALAAIEERLAKRPRITVPAIGIDGGGDGVSPAGQAPAHAHLFSNTYKHQLVPRVGHNLPQEAPEPFAAAILSLLT